MEFDYTRIMAIGSHISVIAPITVYIIFRKMQPGHSHWIALLVIISGIVDTISFHRWSNYQQTQVLFNIYSIAQFTILSLYFRQMYFWKVKSLYFSGGSLIYFILLIIVNIFGHGITQYQGELWTIASVIIGFYSLLYMNHLSTDPPLLDKHLDSNMIINGAIFVYFCFNVSLFIIGDFLLTSLPADTARMVWSFHNLNNIIKHIGFAIGFYYAGRRKIDITQEQLDYVNSIRKKS